MEDELENDDNIYVETIEGAGRVQGYDGPIHAAYTKLQKDGADSATHAPFNSKMDYEIARWAVEGGTDSQNSLSSLLAIEGVSCLY